MLVHQPVFLLFLTIFGLLYFTYDVKMHNFVFYGSNNKILRKWVGIIILKD